MGDHPIALGPLTREVKARHDGGPFIHDGAVWQHRTVRRGERFGWTLVAVLCGALLAIAVGILAWQYVGDRRLDECREDEVPGSDAWRQCSSSGDFFG